MHSVLSPSHSLLKLPMDIRISAPFPAGETSGPRTACELAPGLVNFGIWKPSQLPPLECSTGLSTPRTYFSPFSPLLSQSLPESPFRLTVSRFCAFSTQSGRQRRHLQPPGSEANKGNPADPALRFPQNSTASRSALPAIAPRLFRISVGNYSELVERGQVARGCRRKDGRGRDGGCCCFFKYCLLSSKA